MTNLTNYINYLKSERKSENTIKNYVRHVSACLEAIGKEVDTITYSDMIDWRGSLVEAGLAPNSINIRISSVKNYFNYLVDMEIITKNPMEKMGVLKANSKVKPYITIDDVKAMLNIVGITAKSRAMIAFITSTGLRISEMRSITKKQWDEACKYNGQINIVGKGDKPRPVFISDSVKAYVNDYLGQMTLTDDTLFGNIDEANFGRTLKKCAKKAGLPYWESMSPHCLRAAFATIANSNGVSIPVISSALGHSNISTTSRYIKTNTNQVRSAMNMMNF